jgi:thiosulfate/3-mercaptopyruvate sulfurtransferase
MKTNNGRVIFLALIALISWSCLVLPMNVGAAMDEMKAGLFVEASWLKENLSKVTVVDARPEKDFKRGHLPGAVSAPWQSFADMGGKPGKPGWGVLLPKEQLSTKLGALGIDGKTPLVVYAQPPGWGEDGRFAWMAKTAGIHDVKILNGGYRAWERAGGEITKEMPPTSSRSFTIADLEKGLDATTDWIHSSLGRIKIVDSRSKKEFEGAVKYGEARGGHLPGAVLIAFETMFAPDNTIKSTRDLRQMFEAANLKPEDEIVTYCTAGIRSAHMALVLRMTGYAKARNYDASFYEWAGMKQLPLE